MKRKLYEKLKLPIMMISLGLTAEITYLSAEGKSSTFEQKCSKCHSLRDPNRYTKNEWKYNVERMAKRAGLTEDEINRIIDMNKK